MRMAVRPIKSNLQPLMQCLERRSGRDGERASDRRVGDPFWAEVEAEEVVQALAIFFVGGPVAALAGGGAVFCGFTSDAGAERGVCRGAGCTGLGGHCFVC